MNYKRILGFFILIVSLICINNLFLEIEESNMFGRGRSRRGFVGRRGRGDGSGRIEGYGRFQDGSGPLGVTNSCPAYNNLGRRRGLGDGSGRRQGFGRFQDGSGPQGDTNRCPESNKND